MTSSDTVFAGSIPGLYDRYLGPLLFRPYARTVARRAAQLAPLTILETAAGTGIVTEAVHNAVPGAQIVATDLNPAMVEVAAQHIANDNVSFRAADALDLPFDDETFDLVICQFGLMFFPDKVRGNSEAHRVLRDGGKYLVVVWDTLASNPASLITHEAVASLFDSDPPSFLARVPFGYSDPDSIVSDLSAAGFNDFTIETVALESDPMTAADAAIGLVAGCPLRNEIEQRDPSALDRAVRATADALAALETHAGLRSTLSAHLITGTK